MKSKAISTVMALLLLSVSAPSPVGARAGGASANGDFRFTLDDGVIRHLEFNVRADTGGAAAGQMHFSAQGESPDQDVDGDGSATPPAGVYMKAEFDCLAVSGNRAVMSGAVTETNLDGYVGRRVLLVVEDGGEGVNAESPDRLTWGVYLKPASGWTPRDAERDPNEADPVTWMVRDAERPDDPEVASRKEGPVGCQSFSLASYSFVDVKHGDGNVQVRGGVSTP